MHVFVITVSLARIPSCYSLLVII